MIITIQLTPDDLLSLRFAYSPLLELVDSFRVLVNPNLHAGYSRWVEETGQALYGVELPWMNALIAPRYYVPDFLTPTPLNPRFTLDDEIRRILALPDDLIRTDLQTLIDQTGDSEMRLEAMVYPREMLLSLVDELRLYWQRALAPHWQDLNHVLEGDVLYRAKRLALDGVTGLFEDLHPRLTYHANQIRVEKPSKTRRSDRDYTLQGAGLQFAPSVFGANDFMWKITPEWPPMIIYTPRGVGQWRQKPPEPDPSLEIALGTGRARVLAALATPLTTGEVAGRLDLTAGAVSQHLGRLEQAGLVTPHRSGKRVFYHLTARGEQLLTLFGGVYG